MAKSNAENCKNYRMRKKNAKAAQLKQQGIPVAIKKTSAERCRAYRLRKKMIAQGNQSSINKTSSVLLNPDMCVMTSGPSASQPDTTNTNVNNLKPEMMSSNIVDQVGNNICNISLSTVTHDNRNFITVQSQLPNDIDNDMEYNIMESVSQVHLKPGCTVSKFECQLDRRKQTCNSIGQQYILKTQRLTAIRDYLNESEESSTKSLVLQDTSYANSECKWQLYEPDKTAPPQQNKRSLPSTVAKLQFKNCNGVFVNQQGLTTHRGAHHGKQESVGYSKIEVKGKMSGENVTQTTETKPDISSIENICVKQELDVNIEIEDHDPSPQIKTESDVTSNVECLSNEITTDENLFENVQFNIKQETDTQHNNYLENEDTVVLKKETSDIQTDKAIENVELSNTAVVKEECMESDSLVSYDYPDFNDAASMDSNDATALGNVEACLDSTSVKSEGEVNYKVNQHLLTDEIDKGNVKIERDLSVTETHLISNKVINTTSTVTNPQDGVIQSQTTKTLVMEILPMANGPLSKSGNPEEILPTTYYNYLSKEDCNTFQLNSITGDVLSLEQEAYGLLKAKRKRKILDKEYSCPKCPKLFKFKYSIKKHLEVHDSIDRRAMGVLKGLQTKIKNKEKRLQTETKEMCKDAHVKPEINKEGYKCTCGKVFQRRSRMETCLRSHNLFSDTNTCFSCSTCSKAFKDKNDFQMHRRRLHSKKRFPCKFCPTDYNTRKELFKHLRIHQRVQETEYKVISEVVKGKKKLKCFMCSKSYTNLSELKSHVMDDHKEPYVCRRCKNTFPTIIDFGNHAKTAHPEVEGQSVLDVLEAFAKLVKAWKCEECGLQFHEPDKLALHKAEKHSLVSNITSQCKDCKRVFVNMKGLMSHRRVHHSTESAEETEAVDKGIMCLECRKMCKDMNALTSHMRFHSPERKYPCKFCDFRFATPEKRKTHAEIHTGDMKYVCFICEYQCSSENGLKIHKMSLKHVNMKEYLLTGKPLVEEQSTSNSEQIKTTLRKKERSDDKTEERDNSDSSSSSEVESEVTCDVCGEKFKNEKKMLEHKQTHPFIEFPNDDKPTRIFFK